MPSYFLLQAKTLNEFISKYDSDDPLQAAELDYAWSSLKDLVDALVREDARLHSEKGDLKKWNAHLAKVLAELQKAASAFSDEMKTSEAELYQSSLAAWISPVDKRDPRELKLRLTMRLSDTVSKMLAAQGHRGESDDSGPTVDPTE